jgi:hypothetical protein
VLVSVWGRSLKVNGNLLCGICSACPPFLQWLKSGHPFVVIKRGKLITCVSVCSSPIPPFRWRSPFLLQRSIKLERSNRKSCTYHLSLFVPLVSPLASSSLSPPLSLLIFRTFALRHPHPHPRLRCWRPAELTPHPRLHHLRLIVRVSIAGC